MNRQELVNCWIGDLDNGTFLTSKHDPSGIPNAETGFRTVTVDQSSGLKQFFTDGEYRIRKYQNIKYPKTPDYYEVVPHDSSAVTGSGIPGGSTTPTISCDVFAVVSGVLQGNHVFAEQSANIQAKVKDGDLTYQIDVL